MSDLPLFREDNLLKIFEEIHNHIYANDGLSSQQTLEEMLKILFIKIFDENSDNNQFMISAEEWNNLKQGKNVSEFKERITNLFEQTKKAYQEIFDTEERIRVSCNTLGFIINKLQNISLLGSSQDAKGLAFQKFLSHQEKQSRGQFFTPEPVIDFCVEMIKPGLHETIIDPACGSGGFLMSALNYFKNNFADADVGKIVSENLFGFDINRSIARIAKMKLLLESNGKTNIFCANSLEDLNNLLSANQEGFDILLTNPPFGTSGKIADRQILMNFDLGYRWENIGNKYNRTNKISTGQPAEILFVERSLQLLKEKGRMAVILPNGHFENPSLEYMRFYIKQKAKIMAIVNLPPETFIPFGTGVKTSLLFLQKETLNNPSCHLCSCRIDKSGRGSDLPIRTEPTDDSFPTGRNLSLNTDAQYSVFFGKVKKPGYQGNKNGTPVYQKNKYGESIKNKNGQPVLDEDFSLVLNAYKAFQQGNRIETENSFSVNINELTGRFDYDFYSPENRKLVTDFNGSRVRLGDICEIVKTKSRKLKIPDLTVEYVELSDVNTYAYEIINTTAYHVHELPSRASYKIQRGDIITAIAGNSVGTKKHATALVTEEFDGCICSNGFRVLRNFKMDIYFILYFFKSELFLRQMFMYRTGAAIPNVSDTDLARILIYLPNDKIIKQVSEKMKRAFELRQESKREFESIRTLQN